MHEEEQKDMMTKEMKDVISVEEISQNIKAGLNLIDREEFNNTIRAIAHIAASTVAKTLGPYARTTIIDDGNFTYPTKDGWTVLSRITFPDPVYQSIFKTIRGTSFRIVDAVGDGTTTAMVTADHFIESMSRAMDSGVFGNTRQVDIVNTLRSVKDEICDKIREMAIPLQQDGTIDFDGIFNVAYISSNGNEALATIMKKIYEETGNPNVLVDMNGSTNKEVDYEIQRGYRLDCKPVMMHVYANTSEGYHDSNGNPYVFVIFDHNVTYNKHGELINQLVQYVNNMNASRGVSHMLVLMAPYFDDLISSSVSTIINNMLRQDKNSIPGIMMVQIPDMVRQDQKNFVKDFAAIGNIPITNPTTVKIFNEFRHNERVTNPDEIVRDQAFELDEYKDILTAQELMESICGTVNDVLFGKNFVTLRDIDKSSVRYKTMLAEAEAEHKEAVDEAEHSTTTLMKNLMSTTDRLNRLSGNIGIIHIGGISDLEKQCTMDIVDDTFRACRSAYENGVVPGLNMGTLIAINKLDTYVDDGSHLPTLKELVLSILNEAYFETTVDVLRNKYPNGDDELVWKIGAFECTNHGAVTTIRDEIISGNMSSYDIVKEEPSTGRIPSVLNSAATDIEILNGVISILSLILTSDQYLSVSRFYDKIATTKMQEAANARQVANETTAIISAIDQYIASNSGSKLARLITTIANLAGPRPIYTGEPTTVKVVHDATE